MRGILSMEKKEMFERWLSNAVEDQDLVQELNGMKENEDAIAESFDRDMPIRFFPIKFDKLRLKLEAAKRCGYDKAITFEFSHFMSPQSAYAQAGHLYDRYREYFGI